jgi:hypothetical protein
MLEITEGCIFIYACLALAKLINYFHINAENNMKSKLKCYYAWRVISEDGLLKEPKARGSHYWSQSRLNDWFDDEVKAVEELVKFLDKDTYSEQFVLIKTYAMRDIDE